MYVNRKNLIITVGILAAIGFIYFIFVKCTGLTIPCPLRSFTGFYCPGCGFTTCFLALSELRFADAFAANPVFFILLFFWLIFLIFILVYPHKRLLRKKTFMILLLTSLGILTVFCIIRDIRIFFK